MLSLACSCHLSLCLTLMCCLAQTVAGDGVYLAKCTLVTKYILECMSDCTWVKGVICHPFKLHIASISVFPHCAFGVGQKDHKDVFMMHNMKHNILAC